MRARDVGTEATERKRSVFSAQLRAALSRRLPSAMQQSSVVTPKRWLNHTDGAGASALYGVARASGHTLREFPSEWSRTARDQYRTRGTLVQANADKAYYIAYSNQVRVHRLAPCSAAHKPKTPARSCSHSVCTELSRAPEEDSRTRVCDHSAVRLYPRHANPLRCALA